MIHNSIKMGHFVAIVFCLYKTPTALCKLQDNLKVNDCIIWYNNDKKRIEKEKSLQYKYNTYSKRNTSKSKY